MLKEIPKASANQYTKENAFSVEVEKPKPKTEVIKDLGFSKDMASDFQQMAEHEDIVLEAIAEARENDDIVSRNSDGVELGKIVVQDKNAKTKSVAVHVSFLPAILC